MFIYFKLFVGNFYQYSGIKSFTFSQVFDQDSSYSIFNVKKKLYEVIFCDVQCDVVMTA